jgi:hypothetical protein
MVIEATVCSGLAGKSVVKRSCDQREVETTIMIATDPADSAVVVMCWDNGGKRLVDLMVICRSDGYACFVELPAALRERLRVLDRQFVEDHAAQLMAIAYEGCRFASSRRIA